MKMNAGQLDRPITLRWKGAEIVSDAEQITFGANTDVTVYAFKEDASSKYSEGELEMAIRSKSYTDFTIRYRASVTTEVSVIDDNSVLYNIKSVEELGRKSFLILRCEQIAQK
jgi:head-tail adaptor